MMLFSFLYYTVQFLSESLDIVSMVLIIGLDFVLNLFFGMLVFGLLGVPLSKLFFSMHNKITRKKVISMKYIRLDTNYEVSGWTIVKRAFLLYCIAFSLTLITLQLIAFVRPDILPPAGYDWILDPDPAKPAANYQNFYSALVFIFSFAISFILAPIWYFDDINLMFFSQSEGVTFLYPFGQSVLPVLKGFGGPTIIISYLIFGLSKLGGAIPLTILLDPVLTLFTPITFLIGFESFCGVGKKYLIKWLEQRDIGHYSKIQRQLFKNDGGEPVVF